MRLRATILVKLLAALVVPVVALFSVFALVAYEVSRRDLDAELGRRLEAIAASAAVQVRDGKFLADLPASDDQHPLYQQAVLRFAALANATGARVLAFDRRLDLRLDSGGDVAIGTAERKWVHYFRAELDQSEIDRVLAGHRWEPSVTFQGNDGTWYKTGYAPVRTSASDSEVALVIGAQAPASYFDRLADLRARLLEWGAGLAAVAVIAAVIASLLVTRNVRRLATAAERIGAGDLRAPIAMTSGDELGVLGATMERMRQQLAERDAKMQQMLAGIAHEVRNPLAGMTLFAGVLRDELPEPDERRDHVVRIQRELGYLERVVNDFLEYARRPRPELADVPARELLAEVAELASTPELAVESSSEVEIVRADRAQLRRALLNLARNAVQAATGAGETSVKLSARRTARGIELRVSNRGPEISPETSGKLFEPFYTTREKGTGLGLAFVRDIVLDHGGKVEVASEGGETTFTIVLPSTT
ncbi:MAG TPA: HAMP domain-containing sensor histidine kinase [Kofleriaceae bacterium]|nr:HAMP domain-containing sensor histidine kinase [Kofleriaceae bacterium]